MVALLACSWSSGGRLNVIIDVFIVLNWIQKIKTHAPVKGTGNGFANVLNDPSYSVAHWPDERASRRFYNFPPPRRFGRNLQHQLTSLRNLRIGPLPRHRRRMCTCACVCAFVCVCVCACVYACVQVFSIREAESNDLRKTKYYLCRIIRYTLRVDLKQKKKLEMPRTFEKISHIPYTCFTAYCRTDSRTRRKPLDRVIDHCTIYVGRRRSSSRTFGTLPHL